MSQSESTAAQSTFKPALMLMSGRALAFAVTFFVPAVLARVFTQTEFGTYKQFILITYTLYSLGQFGLAECLFYFLPANPNRGGRYAFNSLVMLGLMGVLFSTVLIVNAPQSNSDVISITGTGTINLSPMTTGLYQGISLWQTRASTNTLTVAGGGSGAISGTFYAQHGTLKVSGGGGQSVGSQYISWDVVVSGGGGLNIDWKPPNVAPNKQFQLVE